MTSLSELEIQELENAKLAVDQIQAAALAKAGLTAEQVEAATVPDGKGGAKVDADLVEKFLVENKKKEQVKFDPVETASMMLTIYTPQFHMRVAKLSSRALRRVIKSLIEYPLGSKDIDHKDQNEKEAVAIGQNLLEAKMVLIMDTYNENLARMQAEAAKEEPPVESVIQTEFNVTKEEEHVRT